jgi:hypothetical protein
MLVMILMECDYAFVIMHDLIVFMFGHVWMHESLNIRIVRIVVSKV